MKNIIKYIILVVFVLVNILCSAQNIKTFTVEQNLSVENCNKLLQKNKLPFCFKIALKQNTDYIDTILVLQYINGSKFIDIVSINNSEEYIDEISAICYKSNKYYRILVSEDIVGLDYFLIVKESPFECYISDEYNFQADYYNFEEYSINFKKGFIEIYYPENQITEIVFFKPIKIE
jgi:hypothetical protein